MFSCDCNLFDWRFSPFPRESKDFSLSRARDFVGLLLFFFSLSLLFSLFFPLFFFPFLFFSLFWNVNIFGGNVNIFCFLHAISPFTSLFCSKAWIGLLLADSVLCSLSNLCLSTFLHKKRKLLAESIFHTFEKVKFRIKANKTRWRQVGYCRNGEINSNILIV